MRKSNVTFADIAKYTGFSKTTISRYFNNPDSLTLKNQKKIADALYKLDYKENKVARILANGKTEFVGVIVPNLYLHYFSEMLSQILSTYEEYGYKFIIFVGDKNMEVERKYISELLAYNIEGMIILSHTIPSEELASYDVPIITIEREDKYVCSVNTDNYMGSVKATELLISNGCEVLIHVNSKVDESKPAYDRIKGFRETCAKANIPYELELTKMGNTHAENSKIINKIVDRLEEKYPSKKKGIFLANDTYANIMLNILVRRYGTLPEDFRIIGFDNSPVSAEAVIPISTVDQCIDKMVAEAMKLLVMQMDERKKRQPKPLKEPIHKIVAPILIPRDTTK